MFLSKFFKEFITFIIVLMTFISLKAQDLTLLKTHNISNITKVSTNKKNHLFIAKTNGDIEVYDNDLKKTNIRFSPQRMAGISFLEASATVRILVFYQELQSFLILDRFLNPTGEYSFANPDVTFVKLATLANDNNIWLIDEGDFSLKKYEVNLAQILVNTSLDLLLNLENFDVNFLKEYQNQLFVNDKNSGILVFDNLGNYQSTIDIKGLDFFSFYQNSLLYIQNQKLYFYNIYQQKITQEIPLEDSVEYALAFSDKLITVSQKYIKLYQIN